jgi:hypothetical protein
LNYFLFSPDYTFVFDIEQSVTRRTGNWYGVFIPSGASSCLAHFLHRRISAAAAWLPVFNPRSAPSETTVNWMLLAMTPTLMAWRLTVKQFMESDCIESSVPFG